MGFYLLGVVLFVVDVVMMVVYGWWVIYLRRLPSNINMITIIIIFVILFIESLFNLSYLLWLFLDEFFLYFLFILKWDILYFLLVYGLNSSRRRRHLPEFIAIGYWIFCIVVLFGCSWDLWLPYLGSYSRNTYIISILI